MALLRMGNIVTEIRGRNAGHIFTANKFGNVLRTSTKPPKGSLGNRTSVNTQFKFLSQRWLELTPVQKASWVAYALNFTFYNKLGQPVAAQPNFIFQYTNLYFYEYTNPGILTTAPAYSTTPIPVNINYYIEQSTPVFTMTWNYPGVFAAIELFVSPPFSLGKEAIYKRKLTRCWPLTEITNPTLTIDLEPTWWVKYAMASAGQWVWIAWRGIDLNSFSWTPLTYLKSEIDI